MHENYTVNFEPDIGIIYAWRVWQSLSVSHLELASDIYAVQKADG